MEKKLTDEEIVKALVHCSSNCSCEYCYHNDEVGSGEIVCRARLMIKAIDLIHRLQDEIKYKTECYDEICDRNNAMAMKISEQNAEIERLNKCVMSEVQVRKCCEDIIQDTIKQTVNDMGKEIYKRVTDNLKMWLRERYGVEVE